MALLSWYFVYTQLIENVNGNKKLNHMKIERKTWEDSQENGKKSGKKKSAMGANNASGPIVFSSATASGTSTIQKLSFSSMIYYDAK